MVSVTQHLALAFHQWVEIGSLQDSTSWQLLSSLRIHPRYCLFFFHLKSNKPIDNNKCNYKSIPTFIYPRSIPVFGLFAVIHAMWPCVFFHTAWEETRIYGDLGRLLPRVWTIRYPCCCKRFTQPERFEFPKALLLQSRVS